jgi:hypothetical protein
MIPRAAGEPLLAAEVRLLRAGPPADMTSDPAGAVLVSVLRGAEEDLGERDLVAIGTPVGCAGKTDGEFRLGTGQQAACPSSRPD